MKLKLDIGCGKNKLKGFVGIDSRPYHTVDIVRDLNKGLPFSDNTIEEVYCSHVVEHLEDPIFVMQEIYRVCRPGAKVTIKVPHYASIWAWGDPTHRRALSEDFFQHFTNRKDLHDYNINTDFVTQSIHARGKEIVAELLVRKIRVGVVILTHNRPQLLLEACESVWKQTVRSIKLIVVANYNENAESQKALDEIALHGNTQVVVFPRKHEEFSTPYTFRGAARNFGARYLKNVQYLSFLDDDNCYYPERIEKLTEVMERDRLDFAHCDLLYVSIGPNKERFTDGRLWYGGRQYEPSEIRAVNRIDGSAMQIRKSTFDRIGGYGEDARNLIDDHALWVKAVENDISITYVPFVGGEYRARDLYQRLERLGNGKADSTLPKTAPEASTVSKPMQGPSQKAESETKSRPSNTTKSNEAFKTPKRSLSSERTAIDICMLTYHRLELTKQVITELLQRTKAPFRLIVVDNNSTDGTVDYLKSLNKQNLIYKLILNDKNMGLSIPKNQAYEFVQSDPFVLTDNDVVPPLLEPDWLTQLLGLMQKHEGYGAIGPQIQRMINRALKDDGDVITTNCMGFWLLIVRKQAWLDAGGCRNAVDRRGADVSFVNNMQSKGWKVGYAKNLFASHVGFGKNWGYSGGVDHGHYDDHRELSVEWGKIKVDEITCRPLE